MSESKEILILGGGLSGLYTASQLQLRGLDYLLVEARDRLGGRILSMTPEGGPAEPAFDLGPAWFWPGQHRMAALIRRLGLENQVFEQYSRGDELFEAAPGEVHRGTFGITMAGSYRLRGGMASLVRALASEVKQVRLHTRATRLEWDDPHLRTTVVTDEREEVLESRSVVIALPPRIALAGLEFHPRLADARRDRLQRIPTWMAPSAKCMAIYDRPFWREQGLSGDAFSRLGPLGEIHDAGPLDETDGPHALFGFFALPPDARRTHADQLKPACLQQLGRLFGPRAAEPIELRIKDWALETLTATSQDLQEPAVHSLESLEETAERSWDGKLIWSGSETASPAQRSNGYLEGALEAAERALGQLLPHRRPTS